MPEKVKNEKSNSKTFTLGSSSGSGIWLEADGDATLAAPGHGGGGGGAAGAVTGTGGGGAGAGGNIAGMVAKRPALARLTVPLVMLALDKQLPSFLTTMFLWELTALCMIMAPSRVHSLPVLVATLVHHVCKHSAQQKMSELPMVHSVSDLPRL
eukprot:CAMPEP_0172743884 /NCGR_PEP_ID=MMETSP1074-20121228/133506_1 /TAXON_ID=2916 /ORGANISM="Ceratium fusus, Strain PA161109" /LENGTH=153 /DNA_ID=CAMNT_0013574695 /DNA_START=340 /DNA_END=803 /DNA_ORIENTATION=+